MFTDNHALNFAPANLLIAVALCVVFPAFVIYA